MKLAHAEQHVKGSSGIAESKGFAIRTNAHAFKMLSSGLYSDKIKAVLREIGCNATDAHIEQGTPDRPIEVKLPNRIDRQFHIRDWGPGLSHDDVMNLYTTYFASTKQTSNDFTGAFGLGSKSPFSYTDAFTVVSSHGGEKRTYSAHLGNDGSPTIALLTTEKADPDWQHGVMIGFPVKPEDYSQFADRAQLVFQYFRVPPVVLGAPNIQAATWEYDGGDFMRSDDPNVQGVLMGNVMYPLVMHRLQGLTDLGRYMFQIGGIMLRVPIGAVQVAASREELQYDKDSTAYLVKRCHETAKHVADDVASRLMAYESADWAGKIATPRAAHKWVGVNYFHWTAMLSAAGHKKAAEISEILDSRSVQFPVDAGADTMVRYITAAHNGVKHVTARDGHLPENKHGVRTRIKVPMEMLAIYHGREYLSLLKVREEIRAGKLHQAILVTPISSEGTTEKHAEKEARRLEKFFPGVDVIDATKMPLPAGYVPRSSTKQKKVKGAKLPPLPPLPYKVMTPEGKLAKKAIDSMPEHFMLQYNNGYMIRRYEKTVQTDWTADIGSWTRLVQAAGALHKEIGAGPMDEGHVVLTYDEMRSLDLPARGWRSTHNVLKEWVHDQATRAAVMTIAGKWRPSLDLNCLQTYNNWVHMFIWLRDTKPAEYKEVEKTFLLPGFAKALDELYDASKKAGPKAGRKTPPCIELYGVLQSTFGAAPLAGATGQRTFLDPADLNTQFTSRFPVTDTITPSDAVNIASHHPSRLAALFTFIQS